MRPLILISFFLIVSLQIIFSQTADTLYKLPGNTFKSVKYKTEEGRQVIDRYEKMITVVENNDSIVYVEFFTSGKEWNVYRYTLTNGRPELSGWQKEYNAKGVLTTEKFCETGERKCKRYRYYSYYPDGELMSILNYYGNKSNGLHFYYYNNGQMRECLEYSDDRLQNVQAYYDMNGNALDGGSFCNAEGIVNIYSMNGKLIQIKKFHKGKVKKVLNITAGEQS